MNIPVEERKTYREIETMNMGIKYAALDQAARNGGLKSKKIDGTRYTSVAFVQNYLDNRKKPGGIRKKTNLSKTYKTKKRRASEIIMENINTPLGNGSIQPRGTGEWATIIVVPTAQLLSTLESLRN